MLPASWAPCGRGTDEHFGIPTDEVDIWTGSLAKSIPSTGGFAAVSQELAIYLQHGASPFIFSAALSPAAVAAIREGLAILKREPERVARIKQNAEFLRSGLCSLGYDTGLSETAVIPGHSRRTRPRPACSRDGCGIMAFWLRRCSSPPFPRIRLGCDSA